MTEVLPDPGTGFRIIAVPEVLRQANGHEPANAGPWLLPLLGDDAADRQFGLRSSRTTGPWRGLTIRLQARAANGLADPAEAAACRATAAAIRQLADERLAKLGRPDPAVLRSRADAGERQMAEAEAQLARLDRRKAEAMRALPTDLAVVLADIISERQTAERRLEALTAAVEGLRLQAQESERSAEAERLRLAGDVLRELVDADDDTASGLLGGAGPALARSLREFGLADGRVAGVTDGHGETIATF